MRRSCLTLIVASSLVAALVPAPVSAQTVIGALTKDGPFPGFERAERDLGIWDAVLVGRAPAGWLKSARFVEVNTRGCDGTCVETRLVNQQTPVGNLADAWLGFGSWVERGASEWSPNGSGVGASWINDTYIGVIDTPNGPKGVMIDPADPRVDVTYPSSDKRVVAVYVHAVSSGKEVPLLRIVYTRCP